MGLSLEELTAVLEEIAPAVQGGWVQRVSQPAARVIVLEIRTPGQTHRLLLSADPDTARLHLLSRRLANPPSPPPFCQFLRAHIHGAKIEGLEQLNQDRLVRLRMTARDGPCSLIAELTGRAADLVLVDGDDRILMSLTKGRAHAGEPYRRPARPPGPGRSRAASPNDASGDGPFPISSWIDARYEQREADTAGTRARERRLAEISKRLKKATRRADALRADLDKAARYRDYARYGELLKANLHAVTKGAERITVIDYFDPALPELVLPLDPAKSPQGNMDDYFKKHRKYVTAEREIRPRLAQAEEEVRMLKEERRRVETSEWQPDTFEAARVSTRVPEPRGRQTDEPRQAQGPFRRFVSSDGLPIYVGRNAQENERLTFGEARPDDLWLHARGVPGSHVVVRLDKGTEPPPETLRDAAILALQYSDLKKSGKGDVLYTRRKYVRKLKGKPPGTVAVDHEKSLFVTLDRARLESLKMRRVR
ncbi:Rqc2 family fibronectin-binding protein [Candidatus Nitrospira bockiana]